MLIRPCCLHGQCRPRPRFRQPDIAAPSSVSSRRCSAGFGRRIEAWSSTRGESATRGGRRHHMGLRPGLPVRRGPWRRGAAAPQHRRSLAICGTDKAQSSRIAARLHAVHPIGLWLMRMLGLRIGEAHGIPVEDLIDNGFGLPGIVVIRSPPCCVPRARRPDLRPSRPTCLKGQSSFSHTVLVERYSSTCSVPPSLPNPLDLNPPNGTAGSKA